MVMLYAAYGSNLNIDQMLRRCPNAKIVTAGVIPDYRLMYKGSQSGSYLTIEKAAGYEVPVGIWNVPPTDVKALDLYEGYPRFYYKKSFFIECADGKRHHVFAYIMDEKRTLGVPSAFYVNVCRQGYRDFLFDTRRLDEALLYSIQKRGRCA